MGFEKWFGSPKKETPKPKVEKSEEVGPADLEGETTKEKMEAMGMEPVTGNTVLEDYGLNTFKVLPESGTYATISEKDRTTGALNFMGLVLARGKGDGKLYITRHALESGGIPTRLEAAGYEPVRGITYERQD
jgi:hypothetical protein